jgi:outer membrane receptor protein involved in Fe transport
MRYALISTYSAALLAGTSLVAPGAAFAAGSADQSSDPNGSQSAEVESTSGLVGDIIVTASRREQSVTSVPYNISAVTAEALSRNGVTDIGKLARSVPGVAMIDRGAREAGMNNTIVIRGITTSGAGALATASLTADTVSTYIGEAPLYVNMAIKDVERVEVLRGPQGTLYGSGSLGGTIRFIFNRPTTDAFSATVDGSASITKRGSPSASGDLVVNVPLSENLALRAVGSYSHTGGFVDQKFLFKRDGEHGPATNSNPADVLNGAPVIEPRKDVDWSDIYFGRVSLRMTPAENLDLQLNYQYQHTDVGGSGGVNPGYNGNDWYEGSQRLLDPLESDTHLVNLDASVDFGFATMTSSSSYYDAKIKSSRDNTGAGEVGGYGVFYTGSPRFIEESLDYNRNQGFVQEVRLTSNGRTPLQYVLGAFYQNTKRFIRLDDIMPGYSEWRRAEGSNPFGPDAGPLPPDFQLPANDRDYLTEETQRFREFALFGELTYNITDRWQVTGGARFFWQRFKDEASFLLPQVEILFGQGSGSAFGNNQIKVSDHIFKANTSYEVADNVRVYGTFSQGFRRGGATALPTVGPFAERAELSSYAADKINNYELGLKGRFGRSLSFSTAIFQIDWKDIQLPLQTVASGQDFVANGGRARSRGFEFEANWQVSDPLSISLGYAYTDAKLIDSFEIRTLDADLIDQMGGIAGSGIAGSPTPGTPKHSATLGIDYRHELSDDRALLFHVDGNYRSKVLRNLESSTTAPYYFEGYSTWNPSVTYETPRWSLTAFVDNVFDVKGITSIDSLTPDVANRQRSIFITRPITAGLRFNVKLGEAAK